MAFVVLRPHNRETGRHVEDNHIDYSFVFCCTQLERGSRPWRCSRTLPRSSWVCCGTSSWWALSRCFQAPSRPTPAGQSFSTSASSSPTTSSSAPPLPPLCSSSRLRFASAPLRTVPSPLLVLPPLETRPLTPRPAPGPPDTRPATRPWWRGLAVSRRSGRGCCCVGCSSSLWPSPPLPPSSPSSSSRTGASTGVAAMPGTAWARRLACS